MAVQAPQKTRKLKKSQLVTSKLNFEGKPISFKDYKLQQQILDANADEVLLKCARQTAKSMLLMEYSLSSVMGIPYRAFLYVAPTLNQAKVFSNDKILNRINESHDFRRWYIDKDCKRNIFEKSFSNGSKMYFRAETQLDGIRGISVHSNLIDEVQDVPHDSLPIIEETMSGRDNNTVWYAGTPKTVHNPIESIWKKSSQIVPVMVCPAGHHNIPYLDNIFPDGVRCKKCKERIDVRNSYFKRMGRKDAEVQGFWVPQIVLPLHAESEKKWRKLYRKFLNYPSDQFLNEVMGISSGEGLYLLQEKHLRQACRDPEAFDMWDSVDPYAGISELWCGVDWGATNVKSFTVMMIGGYNHFTHKFQVVYGKKFIESNHLAVVDEMASMIEHFNVQHVIADWGSGFMANEVLQSKIQCPLLPCMYTSDRIRFGLDKIAGYYKASRNRTIIDCFKQIKTGRIHFYSWKDFRIMAPMFLAEFQEAGTDNRGNVTLKFDHAEDQPDDGLHAFNYLFSGWKAKYDPEGMYFPG